MIAMRWSRARHLLLLAAVLSTSALYAQAVSHTAFRVRGTLTSLPSTCTPVSANSVTADVYVLKAGGASDGYYYCSAANTWTLVGGVTQSAADLRYYKLDGTNTGTGNIGTIATGQLLFGSNSIKYTDGTGPVWGDNTTTFSVIWNVQALTGNRVVTLPNASGTVTLLGNTATGTGSVVRATSPTVSDLTVTGSCTGCGGVPLSDAAAQIANASDGTKKVLVSAVNVTSGETISVFMRGTAAAPIMDLGAGGRFALGVTSSDPALRKVTPAVSGNPMIQCVTGGGQYCDGEFRSFHSGGEGSLVHASGRWVGQNYTETASDGLQFRDVCMWTQGQSISGCMSSDGVGGSQLFFFGDTTNGTHTGWPVDAGECFVASDQTNATATFQSSTCSFSVKSGRKYAFKCEMFLSDSVSVDGAKIDFNGGSATMTNFRAQITAFDTALNLSSQVTALSTSSSASTFTGAGAFEIHGAIEPSADGTFLPRFAQAAHTTGTLTLARGSHCTVKDTP